jgi:archaellum component FlaF (FlaF/FlaG flagellin family)
MPVPDITKILPEKIIRLPLSYLLSGVVFLVSLSVAYGNFTSTAKAQTAQVTQAQQEIVDLRKDINNLRIEMESLRVSVNDLKDAVNRK